jgi:isopenicillin-N epimerase
MLRELGGFMPMPWRSISRLREASVAVAAFVGAAGEDLVLVPNVTTGINAVLQSLPLAPGNEVVITDFAYGAVTGAARAVCARNGAALKRIHLEYPLRDPGDVVHAIVEAITPATTLVIVDHVAPQTALVLPVVEIAAECRARGVPVLVDGAHAPGSRHLDVPSLGADWYAANLHKWAHAPRGCGFLWAARDRQAVLHFPVIYWGRDKGFHEEFEHTATSDPTSSLAAPEGIALLREWGFDACVAYMHDLAWEAGAILADRFRTSVEVPREMVGSMITVPLPPKMGATDEDAAALRLALLVDDQIEVHLFAWRGRLWLRVSAQVYNDRADIERLADAVSRRN